jgi:hypothetical protein
MPVNASVQAYGLTARQTVALAERSVGSAASQFFQKNKKYVELKYRQII